jgi:uncharacterized phage protein gp47/JayE
VPLTTAGLELPTEDEVLAQVEAEQSAALGEQVATGPRAVLGQLNAGLAAEGRSVREEVASAYDSIDPDLATGAALDRVCALTGTVRRAATFSEVQVDLLLAAGASVAAGAVILSVDGAPSRRFASAEDAENPGGSPAAVEVRFVAEESGPVEAPAGTLTVLAEPAAGVTSASNPEDAVVGRAVEKDVELKVRRRLELFRPGAGTVDAIYADVLDQTAAVDVRVFENYTSVVDSNNLPPKSIEVLVDDGTDDGTAIPDDVVGLAVWRSKPAGIEPHGSVEVDVLDARGDAREVKFSRPILVDGHVYVQLLVTDDWTADDTQWVKDRVVAFPVRLGGDVVVSKLSAWIVRPDEDDSVGTEAKIVDLEELRVDDVAPTNANAGPSPMSAGNFEVAVRQKFDLDTSRVYVVVAS